ncbi:MAG: metallophosphoesterase [Candidatus Lokiarchaeota archaeon]|nr:metallophosphoesterase [Candidatus Lokiarchaeota archaeon]
MTDINKEIILIGLISDTHIPSRGLKVPELIINDFKKNKVDYIFHLGDHTTFKTHKYFVETFGKEKIISVAGNMDDMSISRVLPKKRDIEILGYKIFLTHGEGGPQGIIERLNRKFDLRTFDIIVFGHTHKPFKEKRNGKYYFNPGAPTDRKFTNLNSYAYLKLTKDKIDFQIIYI